MVSLTILCLVSTKYFVHTLQWILARIQHTHIHKRPQWPSRKLTLGSVVIN